MDNEALEHRVADLERRLKKLEAFVVPRAMSIPVQFTVVPDYLASRPARIKLAELITSADGPPSY